MIVTFMTVIAIQHYTFCYLACMLSCSFHRIDSNNDLQCCPSIFDDKRTRSKRKRKEEKRFANHNSDNFENVKEN